MRPIIDRHRVRRASLGGAFHLCAFCYGAPRSLRFSNLVIAPDAFERDLFAKGALGKFTARRVLRGN
jgi:hypothetical protein